ncbi:MAG: hypothetical protein K8J08_07740 [Thermoanaerobaculia bacterium]|nr:hypothetical protein [Thermoanaerobaculia bacterium]
MTLEPRQKQLLAVLGGLLVLLLWTQRGHWVPRGDKPVGVRPARGGVQDGTLVTEVVGLDISLLEAPSEEFELGRDPFRYGVVPQAAPKPAPPVIRPPKPTPPPVVQPSGPVPPSVSGFKYLGSFGREDNRIAVLVSGEDIFNLREGEAFKESFLIREIGYESVAIGFVDFPDATPVRLPAGG